MTRCALTEFELGPYGVAVGNVLYPRWLRRLGMQGISFGDALPELCEVHVLLTFVLGPAPEADLWCGEMQFRWMPRKRLQLEFW